jgi:hypothetical protein
MAANRKSKRFFVYTVSDPAPFFGDTNTEYRRGQKATDVLVRVRLQYDHPAGLHYVAVHESADDFHLGKKPLCEWKHECRFQSAT